MRKMEASLLPHEYVHSWNGKYRRPAGLATPDYQQPMQDDLLWVYEGLTNYLGTVLTARSGLLTATGRRAMTWPSLPPLSTTLPAAPGATCRTQPMPLLELYFSPQRLGILAARSTDFYDEDTLNWLWVDVIIRQQTKGKKTLDDFCQLFHGAPSTGPNVEDLHLRRCREHSEPGCCLRLARLLDRAAHQPRSRRAARTASRAADGKSSTTKSPLKWNTWRREQRARQRRGAYSIGLDLREDGTITDTIEGMPAALAGSRPRHEADRRERTPVFARNPARSAEEPAKAGTAPLELLVENTDYYKTYKIDYHGGERYPRLVRDESKPDLLTEIYKAK
jgi:hypothetical protein